MVDNLCRLIWTCISVQIITLELFPSRVRNRVDCLETVHIHSLEKLIRLVYDTDKSMKHDHSIEWRFEEMFIFFVR